LKAAVIDVHQQIQKYGPKWARADI